jgi:ferrous iron transport protein B
LKSIEDKSITIALAGQPNVGKSTVFNMLTGLSQHVGNWPGKTVEQKTGEFVQNGRKIRLVDLPGTYSLTANSEEERIARDFIIHQHPDIIVIIVNACALERNLYLLAELLILPVPVLVGLNMLDVANQQGITVETHVLEAALGAPVVPLIATKNQGLDLLMERALNLADNPAGYRPNRPDIRPDHQPILAALHDLVKGKIPPPYPEDWVALKLLEGDAEITELVRREAPEIWDQVHALLLQHEDAYLDIAGGRYEWIGRMVRAAIENPRTGVITLTDRLDRIATHPFWGVATLMGVFALVFWLTYTIALPIVDWLNAYFISPLARLTEMAFGWAPAWFSGLLVDGFIAGAGTVLTFIPILVIFFGALGILEETGYLPRCAYVMDRFMHWMGLHGSSFFPLFLGFGCNVPAVMGTRIIDDRRARILTILLTPLIPCTGRLAVVAFLAPAFFGQRAALATWGLVAGNLLILAIAGILIHRLIFKGMQTAFIMELPLYHIPSLRSILLFIWHNTSTFIRKAGTIILLVSLVVWALSSPGGDVSNSPLASLGRFLEPLGAWMGLDDWRVITALLSSFFAKENTIAVLGVLFGMAKDSTGLAEQVARALTPAGALSFLVVQMLYIPCAATTVVIRQETKQWKWLFFSLGLMLAISLGVGVVVYQLVSLVY